LKEIDIMRYFIKLSYNGEKFHGWQFQPNDISVQQIIEEALSIVTRLSIEIVGAGRTDAGVHAREMYAHFDLPTPIQNKDKVLLSLNRIVGKDISIYDIIPMHDNAHARFDAIERTYKYFVSYSKSPFMYPYCWQTNYDLDIDKMNEAAAVLLETNDFTSFAKLHSDTKTNICDVREAYWERIQSNDTNFISNFIDDGLVFTISADRFLRNMVRAIVGTLIEVGRNKISIEDFKNIIESKNRSSAGTSMPGEALFLWKIKYPYI